MQPYTKSQDAALLILRLIVGVLFIHGGYAKLFVWSIGAPGMPGWLVPVMKLLTIVEPLGGIALITGFLTRWAGAGLTIIMVGAIFVSQFVMGIGYATQTGAGWNYPLLVLGACIALIAFGAGQYSLDARLHKSL